MGTSPRSPQLTEDTGVASAWVDALVARGVTLVARGKRLTIVPKSAYAEMSDAEHATLRRHRPAIAAIVKERFEGTASGKNPIAPPEDVSLRGSEPTPPHVTPAPEAPAACGSCHMPAAKCAALKASHLPVWDAHHAALPEVIQRQAEQAALRSRLGWDERTIRDPVSRS